MRRNKPVQSTLLTQRRAFAFLEYLAMIIVVIMAFIAFRFYVQHGYQGQMARSGESFSFGRQYDPSDTIVCAYNGVWYSEACYHHGLTPAMDEEGKSKLRVSCGEGCQN